MGDDGGEKKVEEEGVTVCVGDIHGYAVKLRRLWRNLELRLGTPTFLMSTFIFLGDYCDRGPDTSLVLDFLCSLPSAYPSQRHVFLCGNHDFAFAAFLHLLPLPPPSRPFSFSSTWDQFIHSQEREGWWSGPGHENMHVQGRRWAGTMQVKHNVKKGTEYQGSTYDAAPTFLSYGLPHGDPGLRDAVPSRHKKFLHELVWVHEQDVKNEKAGYGKLIAVHAGLEKAKPIEPQLKILHEKDVTLPRIESLSGRKNVWDTPDELAEQGVLVVSGHHGTMHIDEHRLIIDEGGGFSHKPIAAIILPSRIIVRDDDDPQSMAHAAHHGTSVLEPCAL